MDILKTSKIPQKSDTRESILRRFYFWGLCLLLIKYGKYREIGILEIFEKIYIKYNIK